MGQLKVKEVLTYLDSRAPMDLAEDWDNVGLLVGTLDQGVTGISASIELSDKLIDFALANDSNLIVTHHPVFMSPVRQIVFGVVEDDVRLVGRLIKNNISLITLHTNFDRAPNALHQHLMAQLQFNKLEPMEQMQSELAKKGYGYGLVGTFSNPLKISELITQIKKVFAVNDLRSVGSVDVDCSKVAFVSGSGMSFYDQVKNQGATAYITGDVKYHQAVQAQREGICLIDVGHFGAEKHFGAVLSQWLDEFKKVDCKDFLGEDPFAFH